MKIVKLDNQFIVNFKFQWHTRREIVIILMNRIEKSKSIDQLVVSSCDTLENIYFVNDPQKTCKLYFQHFPKTNQVELLNFVFLNR
jgi:hypothetical protein